jgi:AmpE protein
VNLLAVLLALWLERLLTQRLRLREARWLDGYYDAIARALGRSRGVGTRLAAVAAVLLPMLPVIVLAWALRGRLFGLPGFLFALAVLMVCFGPRNLREEVDDYAGALARGNSAEALRQAVALLEDDAAGRRGGLRGRIEEAVFVQANNRLFGVLFWFLAAGPAGAWVFRVSDLLRRRAMFESARHGSDPHAEALGDALLDVHGLLAWLPARLAALAYALAGSVEDAVGNWRSAVSGARLGSLDRSEDLLARVGCAALQPSLALAQPESLELATVQGAWRIVRRALWIWVFCLALLTLAGLVQ